MQLNYFDIAALVILIALAIRGGLRGFVAEIAGLVGLLVGLILARAFSPQLAEYLGRYIAVSASPTVAFVALVIGGMLAVGLFARILQRVLELAFAGWLDHLLGAAAGVAKGALLCAAVAWAAMMLVPHFAIVRDSQTIPPLLNLVRWLVGSLNVIVPMP